MASHLDLVWFHQINRWAGLFPAWDRAVIFLASDAIYLVPIFLLFLWFKPPRNAEGKKKALWLLACALAGWGAAAAVSSSYYHPRPFAMHLCVPLIRHAPDSSFPSDHVTVLSAIGFGLARRGGRFQGGLFLLLALLVGLARIYCGIHFPLDVAGGFVFGFLGSSAVRFFTASKRAKL